MKTYIRPAIEVIKLRSEEAIAAPPSGFNANNGIGNGDQIAPGGSLYNNGAENDQSGKGKNK